MPSIVSGAASRLGRLAKFFRLGQLGHAEAGTEQPARARLSTLEQVIQELANEGLLPTPAQGERWSWSYLCTWIDTETGQRVGRGVAWTVETDAGASYQAASAEARRRTLYPADVTLSPPIPTSSTVHLQCRRIGQPIVIPTSNQ